MFQKAISDCVVIYLDFLFLKARQSFILVSLCFPLINFFYFSKIGHTLIIVKCVLLPTEKTIFFDIAPSTRGFGISNIVLGGNIDNFPNQGVSITVRRYQSSFQQKSYLRSGSNKSHSFTEQLQFLLSNMSITISNCQEICNSPLNISKAKMLYSFPKQSRFLHSAGVLCDKLYDLPSSKNTRAAGFGYGNKYDFTKDVPSSPPPNTYHLQSIFSQAKLHKKGFGFGQGRQQMETTGIMANIRSKKTPGPGTYEMGTTLNKTAFSFKERTKIENLAATKVPGPGRYQAPFAINKAGNYFLSKHKNSRATVFNSKSSQRFRYKENQVPGPGNYDMNRTAISPVGKYSISKFHDSQVRTFGHEIRNTEQLGTLTPGPGFYKLPSEFGHYQAKNALEAQSREQSPKQSKSVEKK